MTCYAKLGERKARRLAPLLASMAFIVSCSWNDDPAPNWSDDDDNTGTEPPPAPPGTGGNNPGNPGNPSDPGNTPPVVQNPPGYNPPQDDLSSLEWEPEFEPDYNNLQPHPWVEPVAQQEQDTVVVRPDELEFSAALTPDVANWEPGRVVVSAPGQGPGSNPLGFARRVVSVRQEGEKIVVTTETVGLEDLVEGDFQARFDPAQATPVDLSQLDPEWAMQNLYAGADVAYMPGDPLIDDWALDATGQPVPGSAQPFFRSIVRAVGGAARAVVNVAQTAISAITPSHFNAAVSIGPEIRGGADFPLFTDMSYTKTLNEGGRFPVELFIEGSAAVSGHVLVNPAFQIGARVPNILHRDAPNFATWVNVDSRAEARVGLEFDLSAGIRSAGGAAGSELEERLNEDLAFAETALGRARQALFGDPDMKPAGGWRRTLFISSPSTQVLMAGPVPVVLVSTFQVDLECGFEAKASLTGRIQFEQAATFRFAARYEKGGQPSIEAPRFERRNRRDVQLLGGGSVSVACGLIPRINTLLYDSAGLTAGLRASLVAEASYESQCAETSVHPSAEVTVGLYGNVGIQVGARLQAPGSSAFGRAGQSAGFDIGPIEPWNTQFPIFTHTWEFERGLGYCTPLCQNSETDGRETDFNCGGGACPTCNVDQSCALNSDCSRPNVCVDGVCRPDKCADSVFSGDETGIDCGGPSCPTRCPVGEGCRSGADCASGFCNMTEGLGMGRCVADHCSDGLRNGDESGVDCGGALCPKCAVGVMSSVDADCESGFSNGTFCVASGCEDREVSPGESDLDCGGTSACVRCGPGLACTAHSDCAGAPETALCGPTGRCIRSTPSCQDGVRNGIETDVDCGGACSTRCADGQACQRSTDCTSLVCGDGTCAPPSCSDAVQNGSETDVDCGGECGPCSQGQGCLDADDCDAGICQDNQCAPAGCADLVQNGGESDVDCGGECAPCIDGASCGEASDCSSLVCTDGTCATPSCTDAVRNASETDVDCGGSTCAPCGDGGRCAVGGDCSSLVCLEFQCAAPVCNDAIRNGNETDVDCGGGCVACSDGQACQQGADCISLVCTDQICQSATCNDAVRNASETDVDCGGSCSACADGAACVSGADCVNGICELNVCQPPPPPSGAIVFLSSQMYTGNLGGLAGADQNCQTLAAAAGLQGTFAAYLGSTTRLTQRQGAYRLVNGTVVANDAAGFFSSSHLAPIDRDERGAFTGGEVWTGSGCSGWTTTAGTGPVGLSSRTDYGWITVYQQFCDRNNVRLYCVQQ